MSFWFKTNAKGGAMGALYRWIIESMCVWGEYLRTPEVRRRQTIAAIMIMIAGGFSLVAFTGLGYIVASAVTHRTWLAVLMGLPLGITMGTITVMLDTYLYSLSTDETGRLRSPKRGLREPKKNFWQRIGIGKVNVDEMVRDLGSEPATAAEDPSLRPVQSSLVSKGPWWIPWAARFAIMLANSIFTAKGAERVLLAYDIHMQIERDERRSVSQILEDAKKKANERADADIAGLTARAGTSSNAGLTRCQSDVAAKQAEINRANDEMTDERRNNRGVGRNWRGIDARTVRLNSELTALQARCDTLAANGDHGLEVEITNRRRELDAEIVTLTQMTPDQLVTREGGVWRESRGYLRTEQAIEDILKDHPKMVWSIRGARAFFLLIELMSMFMKLFAGAAIARYYKVMNQAKAGNPVAIDWMKLQGYEDVTLAAMDEEAATIYAAHEAALKLFETAVKEHVELFIRLAIYRDERGFCYNLPYIRARLRLNWMQNVEQHRLATKRFHDRNETTPPSTEGILRLLGGLNPWTDDKFSAWEASEAHLAQHGWVAPEVHKVELEAILNGISVRRRALEERLAEHAVWLLEFVVKTPKDKDLDLGLILCHRAQAWRTDILPVLHDLSTLEAEAGKAAPPWENDHRLGLQEKFLTPWTEIGTICATVGRPFRLLPLPAPMAAPLPGLPNLLRPQAAIGAPPPRPATATNSSRLPSLPPRARPASTPPPVGGFDLDDDDTGKHQVQSSPPRQAGTMQGVGGPQPPTT